MGSLKKVKYANKKTRPIEIIKCTEFTITTYSAFYFLLFNY